MKRTLCDGRANPSASSARRHGAVMVFALIALLVASLLIASILRTASLSHRQLKRAELRVQATLLADAGYARALARLRMQPDFKFETWTVSADELTAGKTATVAIAVEAPSSADVSPTIKVVAEYPVGYVDQVRISKTWPIR